MTCKRHYACDLCADQIRTDRDGIGIRWEVCNKIAVVVRTDSEHHLCNRCVEGLREMIAYIDRGAEIYRLRDDAEAEYRAAMIVNPNVEAG